MHIDTVPNRKSTPTVLVRRSYREGGKVKKQTLSNITKMPPEYIEVWRGMMRGELMAISKDGGFAIERSLPHGHVAAVVGMARKIGLDRMLDHAATGKRAMVMGMLAARLLNPCSLLATARGLDGDTASNSLGDALGIASAKADDLHQALEWLAGRQSSIERRLARKHLHGGRLAFCALISVRLEGQDCPLERFDHSFRDKRDKRRLKAGVLFNEDGCPVAVEVLDGIGPPGALCWQIESLRKRFSLSRVVLVGDRSVLTNSRIRKEIGPAGIDWISTLRNGSVAKLARLGAVRPSLFDDADLAELRDEVHNPGERLMVCKNPMLAAMRRDTREEMLALTEEGLEKVAEQVGRDRNPLRGEAEIRALLARVLKRHRSGKHFQTEFRDGALHYRRDQERIAADAALDGIRVVRTSVEPELLGAEEAVAVHENMGLVERAFRCIRDDFQARPAGLPLADRVRAQAFLCMLAHHVEWHMRECLPSRFFGGADRIAAEEPCRSATASAGSSPLGKNQARIKVRPDKRTEHSFTALMEDLATICKNRIRVDGVDAPPVEVITKATDSQREVFDLLGVRLK